MGRSAVEQQVSTKAVFGEDAFEFDASDGVRRLKVGRLVLDVEILFEAWLEEQEASKIDRLVNRVRPDGSPFLSPGMVEAMLAGLRGDLAAERWAFDGADSWNARHQPAGARALAAFRLMYHNRDVPELRSEAGAFEFVRKVWADKAKWLELQERFARAGRPNPSTPGDTEPAPG
jgi:hypothetical protein